MANPATKIIYQGNDTKLKNFAITDTLEDPDPTNRAGYLRFTIQTVDSNNNGVQATIVFRKNTAMGTILDENFLELSFEPDDDKGWRPKTGTDGKFTFYVWSHEIFIFSPDLYLATDSTARLDMPPYLTFINDKGNEDIYGFLTTVEDEAGNIPINGDDNIYVYLPDDVSEYYEDIDRARTALLVNNKFVVADTVRNAIEYGYKVPTSVLNAGPSDDVPAANQFNYILYNGLQAKAPTKTILNAAKVNGDEPGPSSLRVLDGKPYLHLHSHKINEAVDTTVYVDLPQVPDTYVAVGDTIQGEIYLDGFVHGTDTVKKARFTVAGSAIVAGNFGHPAGDYADAYKLVIKAAQLQGYGLNGHWLPGKFRIDYTVLDAQGKSIAKPKAILQGELNTVGPAPQSQK